MITILDDHIHLIRSHPEMYLRVQPTQAVELAQWLVGNIALLEPKAEITLVRHKHDWWLIGSDVDWLVGDERALEDRLEVFNKITPFPEAGVNSMRCEILLKAFCSDLITLMRIDGHSCLDVLCRDEPRFSEDELKVDWNAIDAIMQQHAWQRVVAFRVPRDVAK